MQFHLDVKSLLVGLVVLTQGIWSQETLLLMDMSGSMYGDIEHTQKIDKARQQIETFIHQTDANQTLGLHIVGGRRHKGCRNEQMVIPISTHTQSKILRYIHSHEPKGKTPLARAFSHAVKNFMVPDEGRIILISDGRERCGLSACQRVSDIKKRYPQLQIDIMSLATDKKGLRTLHCIVQKSGGRFLNSDQVHTIEKNEIAQEYKRVSIRTDKIISIVRLYAALPVEDEQGSAIHHIYNKEHEELAQCESISTKECNVSIKSGMYIVETVYRDKKNETKLHVLGGLGAYLYTNFRVPSKENITYYASESSREEELDPVSEREALDEALREREPNLMDRMLKRKHVFPRSRRERKMTPPSMEPDTGEEMPEELRREIL